MPALPNDTLSQHAFISSLSPLENAGDAQLYRMFSMASCQSYRELATLLEVSEGSVRYGLSKVRAGGQVPDAWLVQLLRLRGISPEWILTGKGPSHMQGLADDATPSPARLEQEILRPFSSCTLLQEVARRMACE